MDKQDFQAALSLLIDDMEGEQGDSHEIFMRLRQTLGAMRAEGLPVPSDLANMEQALAAEFEADAKG